MYILLIILAWGSTVHVTQIEFTYHSKKACETAGLEAKAYESEYTDFICVPKSPLS